MAMVLFKDGTKRIIKPDAASRLWLCINGYKAVENSSQALYVARVAKLYLGPTTKHMLLEEQRRRQLRLRLTAKPVKA